MHLLCIFFYFATIYNSPAVNGNPLRPVSSLKIIRSSSDDIGSKNSGSPHLLDCKMLEFDISDVTLLENSNIFIESINKSFPSSKYSFERGKYQVCLFSNKTQPSQDLDTCPKWYYEPNEYHIFPNGTILLYGELLEPGSYRLQGKKLATCVTDYDDEDIDPNHEILPTYMGSVGIYICQIGSSISIVALLAFLVIFCLVPTLRNLPGYNLASLSVAYLLGYSFMLIGQIPEVLGLFCVVSGVLQQNFFLAAFFCMNVLAFDVWRTLKLATEKLIVSGTFLKKKQFLYYSLYAWGIPLIITVISVVVDNIDSVPAHIKPEFGRNNTCWMTNNLAKAIFFAVPAFTLFFINAIFFVKSFVMIRQNTMKCTADQHKQTVKLNYILYVKLALMMGITWLMGIVAIISENRVVWLINDMLNSLQGLFLFLLFSCTRKVYKHVRNLTSTEVTSSEKQSCSSKFDSQ